jgi:hypothetical protein
MDDLFGSMNLTVTDKDDKSIASAINNITF